MLMCVFVCMYTWLFVCVCLCSMCLNAGLMNNFSDFMCMMGGKGYKGGTKMYVCVCVFVYASMYSAVQITRARLTKVSLSAK